MLNPNVCRQAAHIYRGESVQSEGIMFSPFCLPGSNGACKDGWDVIGPQLDSRHAPCNLVEIMPRLLES